MAAIKYVWFMRNMKIACKMQNNFGEPEVSVCRWAVCVCVGGGINTAEAGTRSIDQN
jgi:hypothetical protein